jgi:CheY-like chemotaxis protein
MSLKLLWVEEEIESVAWERKLIDSLGCEVTSVTNIKAAENELAVHCFHIVLLDLMLPATEQHERIQLVDASAGISLLARIREGERHGLTPPDVPVIVFSAVVSPQQKLGVLTFLQTDRQYLQKPVPEDLFRSTIGETISQVRKTLRHE